MQRLLLTSLIAAALLIALACSGGDEQQQQQIVPPTPPAQQQEQVEEQPQQPQEQEEPAVAQQQTEQAEPQQEAAPADEVADDGAIVLGGERPAHLLLPDEIDPDEPLPLVLLLHGYGDSSEAISAYLGVADLLRSVGGFALLAPDGLTDPDGAQFWNATDECCDLYGSGVDDAAYLTSLVAEAQTHTGVGRVAAIGVSNGGFMAYRLACESLPGLFAVVSVMGSSYADPQNCANPAPVSVLQIHGTDDQIVRYDGGLVDDDGQVAADTPGATELALRWAERAGCQIDAVDLLDAIELDYSVSDNETIINRVRRGCVDGITIELWSMNGVGHFPAFAPQVIAGHIFNWLAVEARAVSDAETSDGVSESSAAAPQKIVLGGERPATLLLPETRLWGPLPLVVLLHGFEMDAASIDAYFGLSQLASDGLIALILPDGIENPRGDRFWNASPACCKFDGQDVDDVGYLNGLVAEAREYAAFDRLYLVGYSNGGFMSYRMACESMPGLTAIVSVAGSSYIDPDNCANPTPVSVLQIHGTADETILYENGGLPGAQELIQRWANRAGCDLNAVEQLETIELDFSSSDPETTVQRIREGCADGITIELWSIQGAGHGPEFSPPVFAGRVIGWLIGESRVVAP